MTAQLLLAEDDTNHQRVPGHAGEEEEEEDGRDSIIATSIAVEGIFTPHYPVEFGKRDAAHIVFKARV